MVLQRVNGAKVEVNGEEIGNIGKGYVVYLGISGSDSKEAVEKMADKIFKLRVFADADGKTNLSAKNVNGEILIISQFTLMAECGSNRPSFSRAAKAEYAEELYEYFIKQCLGKFTKTASGRFGVHMRVYADNDGPFTLILEG